MDDKLPAKKDQSIRSAGPLNQPTLAGLSMIKSKTAAYMASIIIFSTGAGFLGGWFGGKSSNTSNSSAKNTAAQQQIILNESQLISSVAKNVGESVVSVDVTSQSASGGGFFGIDPIQQQSAGTGVILSDDGYIITNRHVVPAGTSTVSVTLSDGTQIKDVTVVGRTNDSDPLDVAFLKIKDTKGKKLTAAKLGDSSKVEVGDKVIAIGNALGQFQNTVTAGIISGYGRNLTAQDGLSGESLQNLFQTDTAINPGNSGGPLVNINGEVIGINTAIAGGQAQNIGFAIPINDVQGLVTSVLTKGKLLRPYLGIHYVSVTDDYAYHYNLPVKRGAYIAPSSSGSSIIADSPAAKAGLKEKDIITKIDGTAIDEKNSLISIIGKKSVGDQVTLTVIRDSKETTLKATLEEIPQS